MKQLEKTDFIRTLLRNAVGEDVDIEPLAVFEVTATSNVPLRGKAGTIFDRAVISSMTLSQLAAVTVRDPAPLMMDHNLSGAAYGKFFYAESIPGDTGYQELRGYMYVDPTDAAILSKVENGTIDEVSVAFPPTSINCSACGFDYKAAADKGDILPMLMQECPDGHKVADGNHVILNGATEIIELSLVSRGAAKNSRIIGQSNAKLGSSFERLAASGLDINSLIVTASAEKGQTDMSDISDLVVKLSDAKAEAAVNKNDAQRLERELAEATGARNEAETKIRTLEAELAEARTEAAKAPNAEDTAKAKKDAADAKAAADFLSEAYTAVLSATGKTDITVPDNIEDMISGIKEHRAQLSAIIPIDGVAKAAGTGEESGEQSNLSVFKAKR